MRDAKFVTLEAQASTSEYIWVHFEHQCAEKAGRRGKIDFIYEGVARGSALVCGCVPVVPDVTWEEARQVWAAVRRLEGED